MILINLEFLAVQVMEGLTMEGKEKVLLTNIYWKNLLGKPEKPVVKAI